MHTSPNTEQTGADATLATWRSRAARWLTRIRPRTDESSMRVKLGMLTTLALVGGMVVGLFESSMGYRVWPMVLGVVVVMAAVRALAVGWVLQPFERLVGHLDKVLEDPEASRPLSRLPRDRRDEIGRIARCAHRLGALSHQYRHEARALRRDIECRVARSTQRATTELRRMANRDPLTELGNRRYLQETLPALVQRAQDTRSDVLCIAIDVDNFKQINDTFGHGKGDEALVCLAQLLDGCIRPGDLAARFGGDEFVVFLPGAGIGRAQELTETVRGMFRQRLQSLLGANDWADLSIGVASMRRDGCVDGEALMNKADQHLYHAKHGGKGQSFGLNEVTADPDTPLARRLPQ